MYRLALRLGHVNVRAMAQQISWPEWLEWLAFMEAEPIAEGEIENYRSAMVTQAIWNVQIAKAQGSWDAAKTRRGARPVQRELKEFVLPYGDMPMPESRAKSTGNLFEAMREQLMSSGMKPVQR